MIVDCQTHVWKYPGHLSEEFLHELAGPPRRGSLSTDQLNFDLSDHLSMTEAVDVALVLAMRSRHLGVNIPNEYVADYVNKHPDKLIGLAAVDPSDEHPGREFERAVQNLHLQGLALSPTYQNFHPADTRVMFLYEMAQDLKVPVFLHLGPSYSRSAPLKFGSPILVEDITQEFPDLKIVIAHMGYPWTADTMVLIRKHPNVFAEVSGLANHRWQFYNALVLAMEHGVMDKLLFGSDFPFSTPKQGIESLYSINLTAQGTNFPTVPREMLRGIVERNALEVLGLQTRSGPTSRA